MSLTDANAYTNRGHMFVLSLDQLKQLVPFVNPPVTLTVASTDTSGTKELALLDIGAGDGGITERIAPGFGRIVTTETSAPMLKKLKRKGWEAYAPDDLPQEPEAFDVIMCLNVLDRADKPVSLLKSLKPLLKKKHGVLVLAVVLPWCPFVESGNKQLPPTEKLDMDGASCKDRASFELSMQVLLESTILPLGYRLEKWTRLPYISQGDTKSPYYVLSDAVFVLSLAEPQSHAEPQSAGLSS